MYIKPWAGILAACKYLYNHTSFTEAACHGYQVEQGLGTVEANAASWEAANAYSTVMPERQLKPGKRGRAAIMPGKACEAAVLSHGYIRNSVRWCMTLACC